MTQQELITLNERAISLMNRSEFSEAILCLEKILTIQPKWEHGGGEYNLACCYEELQRFDDARRLFLQALQRDPENEIFIGGYGSFLYLHGSSRDAFEVHLKLLRKARERSDLKKERMLMIPVLALGNKLGMSELQIQQHLTP